jgi:hypothetical protein
LAVPPVSWTLSRYATGAVGAEGACVPWNAKLPAAKLLWRLRRTFWRERITTLPKHYLESYSDNQEPTGTQMADKQALKLLRDEDVQGFNKWVKLRRKKGKRSIDLDDQNLSGLRLRGVDLGWAHLNGANLRGTDLEGANLEHARFRQADLRKASLRAATLAQADLSRARCKGAIFKKANLKGAKGI